VVGFLIHKLPHLNIPYSLGMLWRDRRRFLPALLAILPVAEQLALQEPRGDGGAIELDEGALATRTVLNSSKSAAKSRCEMIASETANKARSERVVVRGSRNSPARVASAFPIERGTGAFILGLASISQPSR
jgi:hypothetical protein